MLDVATSVEGGLDPANVGLDPKAWRYAPDA